MSNSIKPTSSHTLWGGAVEIHCFGKETGNWSLAGTTQEDAERNNPGIVHRVTGLMHQFGCYIFAPSPWKFNAEIVEANACTTRWVDANGFPIFRGPKADGLVLSEPGMAFAVSSADCPTVVLADRKTGAMVAAHAGLNSLVDRGLVDGGELTREHASVISAMVRRVKRFGTGTMQAFVTCGISGLAYLFPTRNGPHKEKNVRLLNHLRESWPMCASVREVGSVDLAKLIEGQLHDHGVYDSAVGSDGVCTFYDKIWETDQPLWHSNRRGDKTRNLVLVIRRK